MVSWVEMSEIPSSSSLSVSRSSTSLIDRQIDRYINILIELNFVTALSLINSELSCFQIDHSQIISIFRIIKEEDQIDQIRQTKQIAQQKHGTGALPCRGSTIRTLPSALDPHDVGELGLTRNSLNRQIDRSVYIDRQIDRYIEAYRQIDRQVIIDNYRQINRPSSYSRRG